MKKIILTLLLLSTSAQGRHYANYFFDNESSFIEQNSNFVKAVILDSELSLEGRNTIQDSYYRDSSIINSEINSLKTKLSTFNFLNIVDNEITDFSLQTIDWDYGLVKNNTIENISIRNSRIRAVHFQSVQNEYLKINSSSFYISNLMNSSSDLLEMYKVKVTKSHIINNSINSVKLNNSSFTDSKFNLITSLKSVLSHLDFSNIEMKSYKSEDIHIVSSTFKNVDFLGSSFKKCKIQNVKILDSNLRGVNFGNCHMKDVTITNTTMTNSIMTDVTYDNVMINGKRMN
jgi:uncharacterized protein YjbI with pentapeptide repeats